MKGKLREKEVPHDVAEAEALLKKHNELKDDIAANKERYYKLFILLNVFGYILNISFYSILRWP